MKLIAIVIILVSTLHLHAQHVYVDAAPRGNQDRLQVEGGSIAIQKDTSTSLKDLVERLKGNWQLRETGKAYWIGYTPDMYSIAARGDSAIDMLVNLAYSTNSLHAKNGALFTLHLIGIDRKVKGREYEEFVNKKARIALLSCLSDHELQPTVIELLTRAPRLTDIPYLIKVMEKDTSDCWTLNNYLASFDLDIPINQDIPKIFEGATVTIEYTRPMKDDFILQLPIVINAIAKAGNSGIHIDQKLLNMDLWGNFRSSCMVRWDEPLGKVEVNIQRFLYNMTAVDYVETGCKFQYYVENGKLFICTQQTAKQRLLQWWHNLPELEKKRFDDDRPVNRQEDRPIRSLW